MSRLLIFNPDTDYALASDRRYYTAPAHVVQLAREYALTPVSYGNSGDYILLPEDMSVDAYAHTDKYLLMAKLDIKPVTLTQLRVAPDLYEGLIPDPWGWNKSIAQTLLDTCVRFNGMPSESRLDSLRRLSHRRLTVDMLSMMRHVTEPEIELPLEIHDVSSAMKLYDAKKDLYFKAPWSSSGRGIILTDDLEEHHVEPWVRGIIRRQGSVMAEKAYPRILDFATEWFCDKGNVHFMGYSIFTTSRRGKYKGNHTGTQSELKEVISKASNRRIEKYVEAQRAALTQLVAPEYDGPLGIDMLATQSGAINPCVEVNLRHTMGMIPLCDEIPDIPIRRSVEL